VLGCPNLPQGTVDDVDGGAGAAHSPATAAAPVPHCGGIPGCLRPAQPDSVNMPYAAPHRAAAATRAASAAAGVGCMFMAHVGAGAYVAPLGGCALVAPSRPGGVPLRRINVADGPDMSAARFMESWESRHSDHSFTAAVVRMHCKAPLQHPCSTPAAPHSKHVLHAPWW
jgi:hypothetical protein